MDGEIRPEEVAELLASDDPPRIVDVRGPDAFERGHIPESESVPFSDLPDRVESLADADHVVTVCPHGNASVQAARLIKSYAGTADARVESMAGGLDAWDGDLVTGEANGDAVDGKADGEEANGTEAPF